MLYVTNTFWSQHGLRSAFPIYSIMTHILVNVFPIYSALPTCCVIPALFFRAVLCSRYGSHWLCMMPVALELITVLRVCRHRPVLHPLWYSHNLDQPNNVTSLLPCIKSELFSEIEGTKRLILSITTTNRFFLEAILGLYCHYPFFLDWHLRACVFRAVCYTSLDGNINTV